MKRNALLGCRAAAWLLACGVAPGCGECSGPPASPVAPTTGAPASSPSAGAVVAHAARPTVRDRMPADVDVVIDLDLQGMRASPLLARLAAGAPQAPIPEFVQKCGFNPLARIRHASLGFRTVPRGDADSVFIVESDISQEEMVQCITRNRGRPLAATVQGTRLVWQTDDRATALVVASPGLIVAGTPALVERTVRVIDGSFPAARTNQRLAATLDRLDETQTIRIAMLFDGPARDAMGLGHAPDMEGVLALAAGAGVGADLHGSVSFIYDSTPRAAAAGTVMAAEMMTRLRGFGVQPGEVRLGVSVQNAEVALTFSVSADAVIAAMNREQP